MLSRKKVASVLAEYATPFAAGALIAAVFLDLLKDGLEQSGANMVFVGALTGILVFFYAERFLHWFHHHHQHEDADPSKSLIVVGDTVHNALDGVAIAAAFLVSVPTGIVTTIAIAAHEIPQEIGDFGLLLSKAMRRRNVLIVNIVSSLATVLMAVITFALGSADKLPIGLLLGVSAGFLLYIALSDIIPTIHENASRHKLFDIRPLLVLVGVIVVALSVQIAHYYIHTDDYDRASESSVHSESGEEHNAHDASDIHAR